jgi:hypothetical protein
MGESKTALEVYPPIPIYYQHSSQHAQRFAHADVPEAGAGSAIPENNSRREDGECVIVTPRRTRTPALKPHKCEARLAWHFPFGASC